MDKYEFAFNELHEKTQWVQDDKRFDVVKPWGKHRADVLKEYIEHLEAQILELSVKLANVESKCAEVVAELSTIEAIHNDAVFITDEHYEQCPPEAQKIVGALAVLKIPAYDAHLAELRAQGAEMFACSLRGEAEITRACTFKPVQQFEEFATRADEFAAQLRKGVQS